MIQNRRKKEIYSYSLLMPGTILYLVLFIIPVVFTLYYSFRNWDLFESEFTGLTNYKNILFDPALNIAFKNTMIFAIVTTVFKCILGLGLALFLNNKLKVTNYLRTVFFLPAVLSTVTIGIIFSALMHPTMGLINVVLRKVGLDFLAQDWLTNVNLAIFSVCAVEIWKWAGYNMVILLGGLQSISKEYYEAASIDGATSWQQLWKITIPLIMPAINNTVVLNMIGGIAVFDIVQVLTGGGPGNATQVFGTVIFKSFGMNFQGEACAAQVILSALVMIVSLVTYATIRKREIEL